MDLLGWTKVGKNLIPDPHRQNRLAKCPLPSTVQQLRSYLGGYRTFYRCKKGMAAILKELEEFQAGKKSSEKIVWTEPLKEHFENSKKEITDLDNLYLPKPDDQLVMTRDEKEGVNKIYSNEFFRITSSMIIFLVQLESYKEILNNCQKLY